SAFGDLGGDGSAALAEGRLHVTLFGEDEVVSAAAFANVEVHGRSALVVQRRLFGDSGTVNEAAFGSLANRKALFGDGGTLDGAAFGALDGGGTAALAEGRLSVSLFGDQ